MKQPKNFVKKLFTTPFRPMIPPSSPTPREVRQAHVRVPFPLWETQNAHTISTRISRNYCLCIPSA